MYEVFGLIFPDSETGLNTVGLILDIGGAYLLFKYGLPASLDIEGRNFVYSGTDEEEKEKARLYDKRGKIGLVLLILGFILQMVSNYF